VRLRVRGLHRALAEAIEDSAVPGAAGLLTLLAQASQLPLQLLQVGDAGRNVGNVLIEQCMGGLAVVQRLIAKAQQLPDLTEPHAERPAMDDEAEAFAVRRAIQTVVGGRTSGPGKQAFTLVITDGLDRAVGAASELADAQWRVHGLTLKLLQGFYYTPPGGPTHGHEPVHPALRTLP
jgi:hypothetical protein